MIGRKARRPSVNHSKGEKWCVAEGQRATVDAEKLMTVKPI